MIRLILSSLSLSPSHLSPIVHFTLSPLYSQNRNFSDRYILHRCRCCVSFTRSHLVVRADCHSMHPPATNPNPSLTSCHFTSTDNLLPSPLELISKSQIPSPHRNMRVTPNDLILTSAHTRPKCVGGDLRGFALENVEV